MRRSILIIVYYSRYYYRSLTMNKFSAELLGGNIRFGKYPTDEEVQLLKNNGYIVFLDLCTNDEITWTPYNDQGLYYNSLPIIDRTPNVGDLTIFRTYISQLTESVRQGYKLYIHCRGGHGRSAMVAAIIYGKLTNSAPQTYLLTVKEAHQLRTEMKPKYRKMGAPQTAAQKKFVLSELL